MLTTFVLNIFIAASLNQLWALINTQQLIVLMPLFDTKIPANAGIFFNQIMEIAAFDFIEVGDYLDEWLGLEPIEPENPNFVTLGLGSIFLLNNMGTLAIAYLVWFTAALIAMLVKLGVHTSKRMRNMYTTLKRKLFFNSLISLFVESYSLLCVCCLINTSYISLKTFGFGFHSVICVFFFGFLVLFPTAIFWYIRRHYSELDTPFMRRHYGNLYEELNLKEGEKVLLQPIFFLVRRMQLALAVVVVTQALIW